MMTEKSPSPHITEESLQQGYERSDVNILAIVTSITVCLIAIILSVFFVDTYFIYTKEQLLREANDVTPKELLALRSQDKEILSSYAVIDQKKGKYRIPIAIAMENIATEAFEQHHKR